MGVARSSGEGVEGVTPEEEASLRWGVNVWDQVVAPHRGFSRV